MNRDLCYPTLTWQLDTSTETITGVTVGSAGNVCIEPIPVSTPNFQVFFPKGCLTS